MPEQSNIRILCAADIHLGRAPYLDPTPWMPLTARTSWDFVTRSAIEQDVDLVILAGDVIESDNMFFETRAPLRKGIRDLLDHGIWVAAVAGNHDWRVFPELLRDIRSEGTGAGQAEFRLLGSNENGNPHGTWTVGTIPLRKGPLTLVGWSFPNKSHPADPLTSFPVTLDRQGRTLGILHTDFDRNSVYAPVRPADLEGKPVDAWILGHIHKPTAGDGKMYFYCGSPLPLRSTEMGAHGCWILEYEGNTLSAPILVPSPVRIDRLEVSLDGTDEDVVSIHSRISQAVQTYIQELLRQNPGLRTLFIDLRTTGTSELPVHISPQEFELEYGGVEIRLLGPVDDQCLPRIPLADWAAESSSRGRLARMLASVRDGSPDPEAVRLMTVIRQQEANSRFLPSFNRLEKSVWESSVGSEAWARELLTSSLTAILAKIRAQEAKL